MFLSLYWRNPCTILSVVLHQEECSQHGHRGRMPARSARIRAACWTDEAPECPGSAPCALQEFASWLDELNLPRSRGDQRAGQSPEPKKENRPPVFVRRALHPTRPANPRNRNALQLSLLPGLRGLRLQEILPRCPSRAVPLLPRSRALAISKRLLGLSGARHVHLGAPLERFAALN